MVTWRDFEHVRQVDGLLSELMSKQFGLALVVSRREQYQGGPMAITVVHLDTVKGITRSLTWDESFDYELRVIRAMCDSLKYSFELARQFEMVRQADEKARI